MAISVEGPTEEEFANRSLVVHLQSQGIHVTPILIGRARQRVQGGGNVTIHQLAGEIRHLLHGFDAVTSFVDFYGFRGKGTLSSDELLEAIRAEIGQFDERFVFPYIQMHEFEGLLFSDVDSFERVIPGAPIADLNSIRAAFDTPEDINDDPNTAPSKRIRQLIPTYRKRLHGPGVALETGLDEIRRECPRFDTWMGRIEALGEDTSG